MDAATGSPTTAALGRSVPSARTKGPRVFYTGLSVAMFVIVVVGFAPTYYLKAVYSTPALASLYHVHGAFFTTWLLLMILQPALVAAARTPLHRKIGVAGGAIAAVMTVLALVVSIDLGRRGSAPPGIPPLAFMMVPLATVAVFPAFVGAALWWRQFPATHKRLMMLATIELLPAGVGRWPVLNQYGPLVFFGGADLLIVAMLAHDRLTTGRFHRATLIGGALLVASQVLRVLIGFTETWQSIARSLIA